MKNKRPVILSLEQALALPYATQRMVQAGWRVIRIESPASENSNAGDPNRYIGVPQGFHDLHSYYIAPNVGKEAITINLRKPEGRKLLLQLIRELDISVFMCNTLPKRYTSLGIDYKTLKEAQPGIIWCGISAMGLDFPDRAGYDPALQAMMGFTYLTGEPNGKPVPSGIPLIDLKAGDEAFTQVLMAMLNKEKSENEIHISMAQCAASWLITALPQLNFVNNDNELFTRSGNEHRSFIPSNAYPTLDGFVYLAIGNDIQWQKLTQYPGFESLASPSRTTNEGRKKEKENIYVEIEQITTRLTTQQFTEICLSLDLAVAPINTIKQVAELDWVKNCTIHTCLPDEKNISLAPASYSTPFLKEKGFNVNCAPRLGADNERIYKEAGFNEQEIYKMIQENVI